MDLTGVARLKYIESACVKFQIEFYRDLSRELLQRNNFFLRSRPENAADLFYRLVLNKAAIQLSFLTQREEAFALQQEKLAVVCGSDLNQAEKMEFLAEYVGASSRVNALKEFYPFFAGIFPFLSPSIYDPVLPSPTLDSLEVDWLHISRKLAEFGLLFGDFQWIDVELHACIESMRDCTAEANGLPVKPQVFLSRYGLSFHSLLEFAGVDGLQ